MLRVHPCIVSTMTTLLHRDLTRSTPIQGRGECCRLVPCVVHMLTRQLENLCMMGQLADLIQSPKRHCWACHPQLVILAGGGHNAMTVGTLPRRRSTADYEENPRGPALLLQLQLLHCTRRSRTESGRTTIISHELINYEQATCLKLL